MSKPQFLYRVTLSRPALLIDGPTETEQHHLSAHFAYLQDLTQRGIMILVGRTQTTGPETFGIAIFEAKDEAAARKIMEADPAISSGLMKGELFPYKIALMRGMPQS